MESSFRLVRVRGIDIGANWSWLLIFGLILWTLANQVFPAAYPDHTSGTYWTMAVITGVLFEVSLLLHELGHAIRAQKEGMQIDGITLWLLGGVARFKGMFPSAGAEFRIAVAGPAVTAVLIVVFGAVWLLSGALNAPEPVTGIPNYLWQINMLLLGFNMIPALPLDGGRVLRSALWQRNGNFTAATMSSARVGRFLAGGLIAFGVVGFLTGRGPGLWFAVIGWFVLQAGQAELAYALFRQTLGGMRVREMMTPDPQTVDPDRTIASFIDEVAHVRGHSTYPVVEDDQLVGMISLRTGAQVPVDERLATNVRDVMVRSEDVPVVDPDADIAQTAPVLQQGSGRAVVVRDGRVAGIVSMADVARAVEVAQIRDGRVGAPRRSRLPLVLLIIGGLAMLAYFYTPPVVVFAPGAAFDVTGDIEIDGVDTSKVRGKYVLTSVAVQQTNVIGLVAAIAEGRDTAPLSAVVPREADPDEFFEQQERLFQETQTIAAAAAAKAAGMKVDVKGTGARIAAVTGGTPAADVLENGDVIVEIDGEEIDVANEVSRIIRARPSGTSFDLTIERDERERKVEVASRAGVAEGAPGIGVLVDTRDFDVSLPFEVEFDKREIGGPSAGLTYALAIYDLIEDADIAKGRVIATTGTIDLEGLVGPIGGVEEKAIAADGAKADLFLVPEPEIEAARGAGVDVIGITTLEEAIEALR